MVLDLVLKDCKLVLPQIGLMEADVGIKSGKIASISKSLESSSASRVLDVRGKVVLPGVVDAHSHFGIYRSFKRDAVSESGAAATGGITTVLNIIRPRPYYLDWTGSLVGLHRKLLDLSKGSFIIDYGFTHGPVERAHLEEIEPLAAMGVSDFKFWMHYRNFKFSDEPYDAGFLYELMKSIAGVNRDAKRKLRLSIHCEDPDIIRVSGQTGYGIRETGKGSAASRRSDSHHALEAYCAARPPPVEAAAVSRAIDFAYLTGCPINILHITSQQAMDAAVKVPLAYPGVDLTREVVVHHLVLTTESKAGVLAKVNPPIRHKSDVEALWRAIENGSVDVVASDHAMTPIKLKRGGVWKAVFGFGGNTLVLPVMLSEGFHKRGIPLTKISELLSYNPARIHGLYPLKGEISVGSDADLVVVDINKKVKVSSDLLNSDQEYTPFDGYELKGWPVMTISRGEVVFEDGQVIGKTGRGKHIKRPVSSR